MPGQESDGPSCEEAGALSAEDVLLRLQELVDAKSTAGGYPLEWAVPAYFLGDVGALASLSLRCRR